MREHSISHAKVSHAVRMLSCLLPIIGLVGCGGGAAQPTTEVRHDSELHNAASAGQLAFARGDADLAAEQYRRALQRARLQDDPALIGDQAYNLAIALAAVGRISEAQEHLAEARAALRRSGEPMADVLLVQARLLYAQSSPERPEALARAEQAAQLVLEDPASKPALMHRVQVALLLAEISCDRRDAEAVNRQLTAARAGMKTSSAPATSAALARVTGRLQLMKGDAAMAASSFDEEATLQRQAGRYSEMARALSRSGDANATAGRWADAADRYYRAAASYAAQNRFAQATAAINAADRAASASADTTLLQLIKSLRSEILTTASVTEGAPKPATATSPSN